MEKLILKGTAFYVFGIQISLYGLMIAIGMVAGLCVASIVCKQKGKDTSIPITLALYALPLAIVGARLYWCAFNSLSSFWQVFKIWEGGMAIYGGVIGGFLGIVLCCAVHKYSLAFCCDIAASSLILGQAIGRIGCYFGGCCYGIETTIDALKVFPLSVQIDGVWHLSTMFYESFLDFIGFVIIFFVATKSSKTGYATSVYLIIYGTIRALLEAIRDEREALTAFGGAVRVSQLLSILLIAVGIAIAVIVWLAHKKEAKS